MTSYPHRYGDTDRAMEHYATACVASARVLRSEGHPDEAADLEAEAGSARTAIDHLHQQPHQEREPAGRNEVELEAAVEGDVPGWWR